MSANSRKVDFIPGSDADSDEIFRYPFTVEDNTINYLRYHGRIMFIIRGPAGTGKDSLAAMLSSKEYPGAVICCADHYFKNTFSSGKRDKESLKQSHEYCKKKVETSCQKGIHPIVVKNTHIKKFELQNYLNLAAEYNYTVIMASTMNKFVISPEILAKSNTKGLNVQYFMSRLKQWQDIIPVLVGWFISPEDSSYLLNELQISLDYLLGDGKFCRILNVFEKEKLLEHYKAKRLLYCIAACSEKNSCIDLKSYYTSDYVKEHYGQCFTLIIQGFLVTPTNILAIVHIDKSMQDLHESSPFITPLSETDISDTLDMQSLHISSREDRTNFAKYSKSISFSERFSSSRNTAQLEEWEDDEVIDIRSCSCIHLVQNRTAASSLPWNMKRSFHQLLSGGANADGIIAADQFGELEDGYRYCRLPKNAWLLKHPCKISLKSVFTGMYI